MVQWWGQQGKLCSGGVQVCEVVSDLGLAPNTSCGAGALGGGGG